MKDEILSKVSYDPNTFFKKGWIAYEGRTCMQHPLAFSALYDLIKDHTPTTIVEIGTFSGGLTKFLLDTVSDLNLTTQVISYDVHGRHGNDQLKEYGADIRVKNVFDSKTPELLEEVKNDIQSPGMTLVLCDGGNKPVEFNTLSRFLQAGDIIMAHDYSVTRDYYEQHVRNKIWNFCESTLEELKPGIDSNNLKPHREELFQNCVWACYIV